jgi:hypothetical protein
MSHSWTTSLARYFFAACSRLVKKS